MGGSMLRDFAIVSTAMGASFLVMKQTGLAGLVSLFLGVFLSLLTTIPFNESNYHPVPGLILGGGIIVGSIVWICCRKTDYHVDISSASGEIHALTSKDKAYAHCIVQSINDAIVKYQ